MELVVVLGIMAVLSSVVMFNHGKFQGKIDTKVLANDMALQILKAQKNSINGVVLPGAQVPSYGLYFHTSAPTKFVYFTDLNNDGLCEPPGCTPSFNLSGGDALEILSLTKGNYISSLEVVGTGGCPPAGTVTNLTILFKRPSFAPAITRNPPLNCNVSYIVLNVTSPKGAGAKVKLYASGRVQIN